MGNSKNVARKEFASKVRRPLAERFWEKVNTHGECWEWDASCMGNGYGKIRNEQGVYVGAHRVSYELAYGTIPYGMHILHRCDNPRCVRPEHLFAGTPQANGQDMHLKGRNHRQLEALGRAQALLPRKLNWEQVHEIRQRYAQGNISKSELGREFHVSNVLVSLIVRGKAWKEG